MHKQPRWFWLILWFLPLAAHAQDGFTLTADRLQNGQAVELDKLGWKYSPSDDPRFAEPQFDDRAWESLNDTVITFDSLPQSGWRGIGWFRLHLRVPPELSDLSLNLEMSHIGASEIYLNGKPLGQFGIVSQTAAAETVYNPNATPLSVIFPSATEQVLAIRYSNQQADSGSLLHRMMARRAKNYGGVSFRSRLKRFGEATNQGFRGPFSLSYDIFQGAVFLSFGVLYLLLFAFFSRLRANLFYSLMLVGTGLNNFCLALFLVIHSGQPGWYLLQVAGFIVGDVIGNVSLLAFLYAAFWQRIPWRLWFFLGLELLSLLSYSLAVEPFSSWMYSFVNLAITLEWLRIIFIANRQHLPGARIIGLGITCYSLVPLREAILYVFPLPATVYVVIDALANYGGMLAFSIYLAREFARTNQNLEDKLVQVKQLSAAAVEHEKVKAENERRARELEEARQLQLSMLPKKLPSLPHLDIAAYMKTATEVGGDYYDFHTGEDGTLTIAVGDATGHGLKAGTMVTAVKSLFDTLAYHPDIPHIFERLTRTLKRMNLRGLFMAMTVAKIKQHQIVLSVAGMPPVLLYRAVSQQVEVVELKALPLGGVVNYRYQQLTFELVAGDAVVLMSDGLPERFNAQSEMLGEEPVQALLAQVGTQSAADIIAALIQTGDAWAGTHPQDDDVTLVVLKAR